VLIYFPFKAENIGNGVLDESATKFSEALTVQLSGGMRIRELDGGSTIQKSLAQYDNEHLKDGVLAAVVFDNLGEQVIGVGTAFDTLSTSVNFESTISKSYDDLLSVTTPIYDDPSDSESAIIGFFKIQFSKEHLNADITSTFYISILFGLIILVVFAAAGYIFSKRVGRIINEAIISVQTSTLTLLKTSDQLAKSGLDMADGASQQASSLEETSAAVEEITSMTTTNSEHAQEANTLAQETRESINKGNVALKQMDASMESLRSSTEETSNIIKTIDEIAFQTNLLALNAAVEAARAGEAGQGFAVVAEEVRNLAIRSSQAAKETSEIIQRSQEAFGQSEEKVTIVSNVLTEIIEKDQNVAELVSEISSASVQQAQGLDQINKTMQHIDNITQNNANGAEENAAVAQSLKDEVVKLQQSIRKVQALVEDRANHQESGEVHQEKNES
jgi:hypothetical protein